MKGILADNNVVGQVAYLVGQMQTEPWAEFWSHLGLVLLRFEDVGLEATSKDNEIWWLYQEQKLILITDNRNGNTPDSLQAVIRDFNTPASLPVFTIGDLDKFADNREYVECIVRTLYDYLLRIDEVRGTGRLYLP